MKINYRFNSIAEFGLKLKGLGDKRVKGAKDSSVSSFSEKETNGFNLSRAIDCAVKGGAWADGAKDMAAIKFEYDSKFEGEIKSFEFGPMGFMPIVPNAIIGLPNSMIGMRKETRPTKIIKIAVHNTISSGVSVNQTLNRGRAILAVIERLELLGFSIELWGVNASREYISAPTCEFNIYTRIKAADESPNFPATAFCLCSTAYTRRLFFRLLESDEKIGAALSKDCYGQPRNLDKEEKAQFDVYFPFLDSQDTAWDNPNSARNKVLTMIKRKLNIAA